MGFVVNLPKLAVGFKLPGVYRLSFDDGSFYIGCSIDLKSRSNDWGALIKNQSDGGFKKIGSIVASKIKESSLIRMDIIELCDADEVKDREAFYLNEYKADPLMLSVAECQYKPVIQYKKDGSFVKRHTSITAAAKYNNTTIWRIQEVLNGGRKSHREMVFIYETDYEGRRKEIERSRYLLDLPKKNKGLKVVQLDKDGCQVNIYDTYAAAGRSVGCESVNIKRVIAGRQNTAAGFYWKLSGL